MPPGDDPPIVRPLLKLSDPDADGFILDGLTRSAPGEPSRWIVQHARFRLWPEKNVLYTFALHLQVAEQIRKAVGPQTITITLNSHVLDTPRFDHDQQYEYRHSVAPNLITRPVVVGVDVNPVWTTPDGNKLGVLVTSIGFEK